MRTIELKPWPSNITSGFEYSAGLYPETGVYADDTGRVAIVNRATNLVLWSTMPGFVDACSTKVEEPKESAGSVTELTLLKALAIAQNPHLATELLK